MQNCIYIDYFLEVVTIYIMLDYKLMNIYIIHSSILVKCMLTFFIKFCILLRVCKNYVKKYYNMKLLCYKYITHHVYDLHEHKAETKL